MWNFLRRELAYFLVGFVLTFVVYLFIRFDADKILVGVVIGAVGGVVVAILLFYLERKFPDEPRASGGSAS